MNFDIFRRKKKPFETIEYYALLWSETDAIVKFEPMFDLIRECELVVVDMTYHRSNSRLDNRCMINFGLKGTLQNLKLFSLKAYQNPNLSQFREDSDE